MKLQLRWLDDVEPHDFDAAYAYLSLRFSPEHAEGLVGELRKAKVTKRRVNDILRASDREPLPTSDPGVISALDKIYAGEKLSPVLVVSFSNTCEVADGYHRLSAVYQLSPFSSVPLRIASVNRPHRRA